MKSSDGSRSKIFDPGQVSHLWFRFGLGKLPLKIPNFPIFFPLGQKNCFGSGEKVPRSKPGRPLIYCGSKVRWGRFGLCQGPSLLKRGGTCPAGLGRSGWLDQVRLGYRVVIVGELELGDLELANLNWHTNIKNLP